MGLPGGTALMLMMTLLQLKLFMLSEFDSTFIQGINCRTSTIKYKTVTQSKFHQRKNLTSQISIVLSLTKDIKMCMCQTLVQIIQTRVAGIIEHCRKQEYNSNIQLKRTKADGEQKTERF